MVVVGGCFRHVQYGKVRGRPGGGGEATKRARDESVCLVKLRAALRKVLMPLVHPVLAPAALRPGSAVHGQQRPQHQRLPVLHHLQGRGTRHAFVRCRPG